VHVFRREASASRGDGSSDADAALLSQQLAMDRLQHGAAVATLTHRAEALESRLAEREDEVRQEHSSGLAQLLHSSTRRLQCFSNEDFQHRQCIFTCMRSRAFIFIATAVQGRQGGARCRRKERR